MINNTIEAFSVHLYTLRSNSLICNLTKYKVNNSALYIIACLKYIAVLITLQHTKNKTRQNIEVIFRLYSESHQMVMTEIELKYYLYHFVCFVLFLIWISSHIFCFDTYCMCVHIVNYGVYYTACMRACVRARAYIVSVTSSGQGQVVHACILIYCWVTKSPFLFKKMCIKWLKILDASFSCKTMKSNIMFDI